MKLYTEEDIANAVMFGRWGGTTKKDYIQFLNSLTPIELPSDEDEEKAAFTLTKNLQQHMGFNIGAKWIRDLIRGGKQ